MKLVDNKKNLNFIKRIKFHTKKQTVLCLIDNKINILNLKLFFLFYA